jgi:hypothetical protein
MKSIDDLPKTTFSGRRFTRKQLRLVQETVQCFGNLSRNELALTICEHLDWRSPTGALKVDSCHVLLQALEDQGVLQLPAKREAMARVQRIPAFDEHPACPPVEGLLESVGPISLRAVETPEERERWRAYIQTHHYLGYKRPFGAYLGYFIVSEALGQELGCFVFSASASWALAPRDQWIGWDKKHRGKLLPQILRNSRFLIFPWVKVPHLASHALSLATKRIADDWVRAYAYRPVLIETFVDPSRFAGSCYRAANWEYVGKTQGRGREDARRESAETQKDIYMFPLCTDWRERLTQDPQRSEIKKRYRNDLASSRTRSVGDEFIALWEHVVDILHGIAAEYDKKWRQRKRLIDSLMLMLLIFRLVSSKGSQSYATTIDDLWDSCDRLDLKLPQEGSIAPSSFCAARKKLDESIFQGANTRILEAYAPQRAGFTWRGHRLFGVDGTKINLPPSLVDFGYSTPNQAAHYPQGLASCLYELRSRLPVDFDLVSHGDERRCARGHLDALRETDVVVYDRGYFSYAMLHQHSHAGIHAIFRLKERSFAPIKAFFSSEESEKLVTIDPSRASRRHILEKHPDLDIVPLQMRLLKYEIEGTTYCLGTTLVEPNHRYPLRDFKDVYHSRWGIEELYKVSKRVIEVEDFHSKTERGVKQELFAHFLLITMNRLFANQADANLNGLTGSSLGSDEPDPTGETAARIQTNFKNCVHVIQRSLEELVLLKSQISMAVQKAFASITQQYQRARPGRSYERKSRRPNPKWHPSKKKKTKKLDTSPALA